MSESLNVVFGTGPIGLATIEILAERGSRVRAVNRSGDATLPDSVELMMGDATDPDFVARALTGATVVFQCLNPPYTRWPELFPPLQAGVLDGAARAGAKLVAMDNLYMYGPTAGRPLTEDLPYLATGAKGSTRAQMARDLLDSHRAGRVRVTLGRASDYFGPRGLDSAMGSRVIESAVVGKKAQILGDPDQPHTYSYIPDIARGLVTLADHDRADGQAWHLPNAPALTTREFIEKVYSAAGTEPRIQAMPKPLVSVVALFNPAVRELKEMLYEFEEPFVVDSTKFTDAFGESATPLEVAIPATVEWFRSNR